MKYLIRATCLLVLTILSSTTGNSTKAKNLNIINSNATENCENCGISLNFIYIAADRSNIGKTFVFDKFRELTPEKWVERLKTWQSLNPNSNVNFWTNSGEISSELFQRTQEYLEKFGLKLSDLQDIEFVKKNPKILSMNRNIALRSDLIRAVVLQDLVEKGKIAFYADLDIIPFKVTVTKNMNMFGFGLGNKHLPSSYGNVGKRYENSVLLLLSSAKGRHFSYIIEPGIEFSTKNPSPEVVERILEANVEKYSDNSPAFYEKSSGIFSHSTFNSNQRIFELYKLLLFSKANEIERDGTSIIKHNLLYEVEESYMPVFNEAKKDRMNEESSHEESHDDL